MKAAILALLTVVMTAQAIPCALAHGSEPHPKCKQGYVLTDDHRCVKK